MNQMLNSALLVKEFRFSTSKSSGKGGQHVNKTESRVELKWDFIQSKALTEEQKAMLAVVSSVHVLEGSFLHFSSELSRSQLKNKEDVIEKALSFIKKHTTVKKKRKKLKVPKSVVQKRLDSKKKRSEIKANRRKL